MEVDDYKLSLFKDCLDFGDVEQAYGIFVGMKDDLIGRLRGREVEQFHIMLYDRGMRDQARKVGASAQRMYSIGYLRKF